MQPYLMYGYGFRAEDLPVAERERLIDLNEDVFSWFSESEAGSSDNDAGVFYILSSSPWGDRAEKNICSPWAADMDEIMEFKEKRAKEVDEKLLSLGLEAYKDKVAFLVSVTEV